MFRSLGAPRPSYSVSAFFAEDQLDFERLNKVNSRTVSNYVAQCFCGIADWTFCLNCDPEKIFLINLVGKNDQAKEKACIIAQSLWARFNQDILIQRADVSGVFIPLAIYSNHQLMPCHGQSIELSSRV